MVTWTPALVAAIPGVLAFVGVLLTRRDPQRLDRTRREAEDADRVHALVQRYTEPLVRAAYDLQSRLWNILAGDFFAPGGDRPGSRGWTYRRDSTLWLFAQYLGWVEIVRREIQFLPPSKKQGGNLQSQLSDVAHILSTDREIPSRRFQVYRSEQRALGELVIVPARDSGGESRTGCMGYAEFCAVLADPDSDLHHWYRHLSADIEAAASGDLERERLRRLQNALIDLVDTIDPGPGHVRFPQYRDRV